MTRKSKQYKSGMSVRYVSNYDNLFVLFKENGKATKDDLIAFDKLDYQNKIVFTHKSYPDIKSLFYIRGFESKGSIGDCFSFMPDKPI